MRANQLRLLCLFLIWMGCAPPTPPKSALPTKTKRASGPNCALGGCDSPPIPDDLKDEVGAAESFGLLLYEIDHASAVGTDVLLEKKPDMRRLAGYLTMVEGTKEKLSNSYRVFFYTADKEPQILYEVQVFEDRKRRPEWFPLASPKPLPAGMLPMIKARQNAINAVSNELVQRPNPVVLGLANGIVVYLLSGTTRPNLAILGKHYRMEFSADGEELRSTLMMSERVNGFTTDEGVKNLTQIEPLTQDALEMPYNNKTMVLTVTHVVTEYPLESHVFANLLYGVPIYVVTSRGLWLVEEGHISYITKDTPWIDDKPLPTD